MFFFVNTIAQRAHGTKSHMEHWASSSSPVIIITIDLKTANTKDEILSVWYQQRPEGYSVGGDPKPHGEKNDSVHSDQRSKPKGHNNSALQNYDTTTLAANMLLR